MVSNKKRIKPIELFVPHTKQIEVLRALQNKETKYVTLIAGRQTGKTSLAKNQCIFWALNDEGCIIYWVSPTDSQMQQQYRDIKNAIEKSGCILHKKQAKGDTEIRFANGSIILFRCGGSEDSLRGMSGVNYLILDEAAFLKKDTVQVIIMPIVATSIKKVLVISTPKGKNWLYDWYNKAHFHYPRYQSFKCSSKDNPYVDKDWLKDMKETLSEAMYQQEIEAEWIDKSSVFNNVGDCLKLEQLDQPEPNEIYYAGIDIGLENDSSVMCIMNKDGDCVHIKRWFKKGSEEIMKDILKYNEQWKMKRVLIENNNQGLVFYQLLRPQMYNLVDINTTSKNKEEMINDLIYLFNTKQILIVNNEQMRMELEGFLMTQDNGRIKFAAAKNMTDDCVMSLAIARMCYKRYKGGGSKYIGIYY